MRRPAHTALTDALIRGEGIEAAVEAEADRIAALPESQFQAARRLHDYWSGWLDRDPEHGAGHPYRP